MSGDWWTWNRFQLWRDVRSGEAGLPTRLALSVITGLVLVAVAMLILGIIEATQSSSGGGYSHLRDEHVAVVLASACVPWFIMLAKIWASYPRFRNVLRAVFGCLAIWAVVIPLCVLTEAQLGRGEEFIIAAWILAALSGSLLLIVSTLRQMRYGKPMWTEEGQLNINCPSCGYVMVGLDQSRCPECGARYTLDELVMKQGFTGLPLARSRPRTPPPQSQPIDAPATGDAQQANRPLAPGA